MVLLELHYFPCIAYFAAIFKNEEVLLEAHENYVKQSYRNRCVLNTANKVDSLSIPVQGGTKKTAIREMKIDYSQSWVKDHWRAIQSAYGKAPYFEYYSDYVLDVLDKKNLFLFDLNMDILTLCLKCLQMDSKIRITETYKKDYSPPVIDLRSKISPKFDKNNYPFFKPYSYPQIFGKDFVANLSVLDLLFCEGPNARTIIKKSVFP